jgi:hypothetical protein
VKLSRADVRDALRRRRFERRHRKHCRWHRPLRARIADRLRGAHQWVANAAHDAPWYARKATVPLRNAAYRATEPLRSLRWNAGEYRRRWAREHGRRDALRRAADHTRSRLPLIRSRVNPATGRKHRDDAELGRRLDGHLQRMRERAIPPGPVQARDYAPAYKRSLPQRTNGRSR